MKQSVLRRVLSVLLCVSLLFGVSVVRPQKAEAFAISASLVASVIMIMTACGVTFWASTQGDAESYISQKLGEYLDQLNPSPSSILDWLGIDNLGHLFVVLSGGIVRFDSNVANPILSFVRWFNQSEGVETGGSSITTGGTPIKIANSDGVEISNLRVRADSSGNLVVTADSISGTKTGSYRYFGIFLPGQGSGCRVTITDFSYSGAQPYYSVGSYSSVSGSLIGGASFTRMSVDSNQWVSSIPSSQYLYIRIAASDYTDVISPFVAKFSFSWANPITPPSTAVTPGTVSVPQDVSDNDTFDVSPSVPLTEGMAVDDASSEIFDGVTSADGLTSTGEAVEPPTLDLSGIFEILGSILNAILAIPGHIASLPSAIASAFNSILSSIKSVLDSIADKVTSAAESIIDGINAKLDNFIYEMEYGFSAVVSSIHRIGQDVRDALMTWLDAFITDVQSAIDTIKQTVIGIPQAISQGAQDVITGIQSLPQLISDALVNLFVPDEAYVGEFVASLHGIFDNRFSILSYPFSILGEFITRASGIDDDEPILRWPDIYEPFSGQLLIGAGSYNLNNIRQGNFAEAHGLYMVVVKGWIAFEFLGYLYSWFCSVFKMREDDFVSPLEAYDGGDDG